MSEDQDNFRGLNWENVARVQIHSRRFGLLQVLSLDGCRTLSPTECAVELHTNVADASYHMAVLVRVGLVRLAHSVPVRGVEEHFYCLAGHSADDLLKRLKLPRTGR